MRVFMSYSTRDRNDMLALREVLTRAGCQVSVDSFDLPPRPAVLDQNRRETIRGKLERSLEAADHVVVLWSVTAEGSPWVAEELVIARGLARPLTFVALGSATDIRREGEVVINAEGGFASPHLEYEIVNRVLGNEPDPTRRRLLADHEADLVRTAQREFAVALPALQAELTRLGDAVVEEVEVVVALDSVPDPSERVVVDLDGGSGRSGTITVAPWLHTGTFPELTASDQDFTSLRPERPLVVASFSTCGFSAVVAPHIDGSDFGDQPITFTFAARPLAPSEQYVLPSLAALFRSSIRFRVDVPEVSARTAIKRTVQVAVRVASPDAKARVVLLDTRPDPKTRALLASDAFDATSSAAERYALVARHLAPNGEARIRLAARAELDRVAMRVSEALAEGEPVSLRDDDDHRMVARYALALARRGMLRGELEQAFRWFGDVLGLMSPVAKTPFTVADVTLLLEGAHGQGNLLLRARRRQDAYRLAVHMRNTVALAASDLRGDPFIAVWRARAEVLRSRATSDAAERGEAAHFARAAMDTLVRERDTPERRKLRRSVEEALGAT